MYYYNLTLACVGGPNLCALFSNAGGDGLRLNYSVILLRILSGTDNSSAQRVVKRYAMSAMVAEWCNY